MKTIHKFPLEVTEHQRVLIPEGGEFLCAQFQGETLCAWALVDPEAKRHERDVFIYGTGWHIETDRRIGTQSFHELRYLATVQQDVLVWHIFAEEA